MGERRPPALLFEQMRSFCVLARTLNLSRAVRQLGSTRQTVRRHVAQLEEARSEALFVLEDRRYRLTEAGHAALREAEDLLSRAELWYRGRSGHERQMFYQSVRHLSGFSCYVQQHPISRIWEPGRELMAYGVECWARARGRLEDAAFAPLRPWVMVFRRKQDDWICVEVGDRSSYAQWFGWEAARSSVGRGLGELPGGEDFANLLSQPFEETHETGALRYDHVHTHTHAPEGGELVPVSYERLLMGCTFPDGSRAVASLLNRTREVDIAQLDMDRAGLMPERFVMSFQPPGAGAGEAG